MLVYLSQSNLPDFMIWFKNILDTSLLLRHSLFEKGSLQIQVQSSLLFHYYSRRI